MMHVFRFQRMEEAFHHGIVPAVPAPTHTRRQAVLGEQFAVRGGGVLGSSVRMMHHAGRRASMFYGHGERRRSQLLRQAAPPPPGNDPTRVEIEHHRQIEPALGGPNVGNIAGPHPIGSAPANWRLSVCGTTGYRWAEWVVARHLLTVLARIALVRMSRATRCSPSVALGLEVA